MFFGPIDQTWDHPYKNRQHASREKRASLPAENVTKLARNSVHTLNIRATIKGLGLAIDLTPPEVQKVNILRALKNEEAKFLKQLDNARQQLETIRSAIKLMGGKAIVRAYDQWGRAVGP